MLSLNFSAPSVHHWNRLNLPSRRRQSTFQDGAPPQLLYQIMLLQRHTCGLGTFSSSAMEGDLKRQIMLRRIVSPSSPGRFGDLGWGVQRTAQPAYKTRMLVLSSSEADLAAEDEEQSNEDVGKSILKLALPALGTV